MLSTRSLRLDQSLSFGDSFAREVKLLADFEYDLNDEDARVAFDRAISNRSVLRGIDGVMRHWTDLDRTFVDFTLANDLSTLDQMKTHPRVKRNVAWRRLPRRIRSQLECSRV